MTTPLQTNAFIGRTKPPAEEDVAAALGASKGVWDQLLANLAGQYGVTGHDWKSYSPKAGWSLRVTRKTRTIVWLSPQHHSFEVLFILGDKAMRAARQSDFPKRVVEALKEAPKYPEGTGVRLKVKSPRDLAALDKLAAIKLAN